MRLLSRNLHAVYASITPSIARLPNRALLSVTGSQAAEFLNGIVAATVPKDGHFYTAFLHAQGRVLYDAFVYLNHDSAGRPGYLIEHDARPSEAPPLHDMLKRYLLRSKVKLRDVSKEYDVWAAWNGVEGWDFREPDYTFAQSGVIESKWEASQGPWGSTPGVLLDRRAPPMGRRLLMKKGVKPELGNHRICKPEQYHRHRIVHGVPEGVVDIPPMHAFPMEYNMDIMGGLDFRKGCYVGQELTVRTYHTGILRKRVIPVMFTAKDDPSSDLVPPSYRTYDDQPNPKFSAPVPYAEIHAHPVQSSDDGAPTRRSRAVGKVLSGDGDMSLALLRLESIAASIKGEVKLTLDGGGEVPPVEVTPWWPHWWPKQKAS